MAEAHSIVIALLLSSNFLSCMGSSFWLLTELSGFLVEPTTDGQLVLLVYCTRFS